MSAQLHDAAYWARVGEVNNLRYAILRMADRMADSGRRYENACGRYVVEQDPAAYAKWRATVDKALRAEIRQQRALGRLVDALGALAGGVS